MYRIVIFVIFIIACICIYYSYFTANTEPLHKYYYIHEERPLAKMKIPDFVDLGVIAIHGNVALRRTRDTTDNQIQYTSNNTPWRKHRELGKFIRHSEQPNCEVYKSSPMSFGLRTIKHIHENEELTTDYYPLQKHYSS